ncbi:MAG: endonuclease/exonuclease/phosphatase family protein [Ginsengibacter sp.]
MKKILLFIVCTGLTQFLFSQISLCSWNLQDFGGTKSDAEIDFIANTLKDYDVLLIQEVVAKDAAGAQAVARLHAALNSKGAKWAYAISDVTSGSAYKAERYAFIWKTSKLAIIGKAWLEKKYNMEIDREPYFATFKAGGKLFTLVNFHSITKTRQPEKEIKYLRFLPSEYPDKNLIFCGDFNCPQSNTVFKPLKTMGYKPIFTGQKTSLRESYVNNDCLASELDNMFYNTSKITFLKSGVVYFYKSFTTIKEARNISDHIPIYFQFSLD